MSEQNSFFIGELAERTGVSRDAIRYYETEGVLPEAERTRSGYRLYGPDDVERIEFIGQAQALGLTLEEIADVLSLVDRGREPCVHVSERLRAHLDETRSQMEALRVLEHRLETALRRAERDGGTGSEGCRCRIIEAAGDEAPARDGRNRGPAHLGRDEGARAGGSTS